MNGSASDLGAKLMTQPDISHMENIFISISGLIGMPE